MAHDDLDVVCYKVMRYIDAASKGWITSQNDTAPKLNLSSGRT